MPDPFRELAELAGQALFRHLDSAFRTREEHKHPTVDNGLYNTKSTLLSINLGQFTCYIQSRVKSIV